MEQNVSFLRKKKKKNLLTLPGFCCAFGLFHRFWGVFEMFVAAFYSSHHHRLESLETTNLFSFTPTALRPKGALKNCSGFVDGKLCKIAGPQKNQRVV